MTSSQQQGIVLQEAYFADRQVTTNDNVGYFVLPKGYFTYRSRSDTDVFVFNRNDILDKGIISYYYPVFQTKYTCSDFLLRRLNHGIRKQLAMAAEGTGQKVLAHSKFKNMTVSVPKIGEQQKIGTFFRQLDRLITLHQCNCNMATRPYEWSSGLRAIAWEQRKLGEIAEKTFGGGTPSTSNPDFWSGKIPWIQSSDLTEDNLFDVKPRKFISKLAIKSSASKIIPKNSIAIIVRVGVGKLAFLPFNYSTSQDFLSITEINVDELFALYSIYKKLKKDLSLVQGTSIKGITKEELLRKTLFIPIKKSEQARIGAFFRHLDRLITLHQRKHILLT